MDLDMLKQSVNIVDVIGADQRLRQVGVGKWEGEEHDSLKVGEDVQLWNWFSRGYGGSVIDWPMRYRGYSFIDAINYVSDFSRPGGAQIPYTATATAEKKPPRPYNVEIANVHYEELLASAEGQKWWREQGITEEAIQEWKLGWASEHYFSSIGGCSKAGVIPYFDQNDVLMNVWCRLVPGNVKRYLPYETHHTMSMFAPQFIGDEVVLVEGAKKAIVLWQYGFLAAALNGFNNYRACGGEELFKDVKTFYLCLDPGLKGPDSKPIHPTQLKWVRGQAIRSTIKIVELTMKPDDYILRYGKDKFAAALKNARSFRC